MLIVPDKFKDTLTARAAANAIACGWRTVRPQDSSCLLPMTDGGDGFGEVISALLDAGIHTIKTLDAAHSPITARWWRESKTAIIESAAAIYTRQSGSLGHRAGLHEHELRLRPGG